MGDISPLLTALWGVLLVFLVLLSARMVVARRRVALASPAPAMPDPAARRPQGRHAAAAPAASRVMTLGHGPLGLRRRRRPLDEVPSLVLAPVEPAEAVAVEEAPAALEADAPATVAPDPGAADSGNHDAMVPVAGDVDAYRRRVQTTIRAMSRRTEAGESPELVEARLLAAVDRLDGPVGFARPRLSPAGLRHPSGRLGQLTQLVPPAHPAELPAGELADERPVDASPIETDLPTVSPDMSSATSQEPEPEGAQPEPSVLEEDEVVLPVPPLEASSDIRRRGLRRRGKVG